QEYFVGHLVVRPVAVEGGEQHAAVVLVQQVLRGGGFEERSVVRVVEQVDGLLAQAGVLRKDDVADPFRLPRMVRNRILTAGSAPLGGVIGRQQNAAAPFARRRRVFVARNFLEIINGLLSRL